MVVNKDGVLFLFANVAHCSILPMISSFKNPVSHYSSIPIFRGAIQSIFLAKRKTRQIELESGVRPTPFRC